MDRKLHLSSQYSDMILAIERNYANVNVLEHFLAFVNFQKSQIEKCETLEAENSRLNKLLANANEEIKKLEAYVTKCRHTVDDEIKWRREAEEDRNIANEKLKKLRDMVMNFSSANSKRETLEIFKNITAYRNSNVESSSRLNPIQESDSTDSILSGLSITRSEDNIEENLSPETKKLHFLTHDENERSAKRIRISEDHQMLELKSNEQIIATTTINVGKNGPINAKSTLESVKISEKENTPLTPKVTVIKRGETPFEKMETPKQIYPFSKKHQFQQKPVLTSEQCVACEKNIKFGKMIVKCKDCRCVFHPDCKDTLKFSCTPLLSTPSSQNRQMNFLSDNVPTVPPLIPPLIQLCVQEIENRGLDQIGLYRIPGSEKEVKALKEKLRKGKSMPNFNAYETPVICCTIKDFFRTLSDPLIPQSFWRQFIAVAASNEDSETKQNRYFKLVEDLPSPNRDTLAFMILHLQKIANCKDSKMPICNLAVVFAPTIVGYSSTNVNQQAMLNETKNQVQVMENLLEIDKQFWLDVLTLSAQMNMIQSSSSTNSLAY